MSINLYWQMNLKLYGKLKLEILSPFYSTTYKACKLTERVNSKEKKRNFVSSHQLGAL